jgi:hypothetical protein
MKSRFTLFGLLFLSLAWVVTLPGAMAGDGYDQIGGGFGFGQKVAGTFMDEGGLPAIGASWIGTMTFNADGTVTTTNTSCCLGAGTFQSPGHGVWERTGNMQITLTALIFIFNADGTDNAIAKPTIVIDFDQGFDTAAGVINTEIFLPGMDPLVDAPVVCFAGPESFRRLHVTTLGCPAP